jgi:hypothetical protein
MVDVEEEHHLLVALGDGPEGLQGLAPAQAAQAQAHGGVPGLGEEVVGVQARALAADAAGERLEAEDGFPAYADHGLEEHGDLLVGQDLFDVGAVLAGQGGCLCTLH